ncbi:hypothetical protein N7519_001983 [Penicillium mononematosum]|uniref:uncharacterized protein n=1 Tax=Penicillium mononematosum TaxID=268346 RepID=UPI0025481D89|nr:uncharacterized protein N7519_001983 [Penicillium mononematosum]KAJ6187075.1 hypothetical protein N7519_001983 [Penicillium mononematosum]
MQVLLFEWLPGTGAIAFFTGTCIDSRRALSALLFDRPSRCPPPKQSPALPNMRLFHYTTMARTPAQPLRSVPPRTTTLPPCWKPRTTSTASRLPSPPQLSKLILYFSFALALLSAVNVALLPTTLSKYQAYPLSDSDLEALPYGDARLGLDRVAKFIPPPQVYHHAWPDRIARVSRKLKNAVWGQGVQVYVTVEVRIPTRQLCASPSPAGVNACALSWRPPPEFSARAKDLITKGDITEIEVWQLIAPVATSAIVSSTMDELDFDTVSYSTLPVRGELLGVLDLTAKPNSTTLEFGCPSAAESLVVEMRCQRVACHVEFMQIDIAPSFGFELVRRRE